MTNALFADPTARTITGLLLPFGELSAPNLNKIEPIMFSAATVQLPADPSVVTLNEEHSQFAPRGRAVTLSETAAGIVAEFSIARTPEGDALLAAAQHADPAQRPRLSAELTKIIRRGAHAVSSVLTGAAITRKGAFASAGLFSAVEGAVDILEDAEDELEADPAAQAALVETVTAAVLDALKTADANTEPDPNPVTDPDKEETMTASAPAGLPHPSNPATDKTTATGLFAALARSGQSGDRSALAAFVEGSDALFALGTVQHAGPTTLTIGADIQEPAYIGQLWARNQYQRRFWDLGATAPLTAFQIAGWRFAEGKEPAVAAYTGNTAEVPSNAVDTEPVTATARRIAGGHRIDRRFTDFSDQAFWEAYFAAMVESYARVSDLDALSTMVTASTATSPGTVPSGVAAGLAAVVDGALAVIATENTPSFAVVSAELWRDIVLTGKDEVLGYLSASFGLEEGSTAGFRIIPGPVGVGKVLVGARNARTMYELPGSPIRVEGLVPGNGAIEPALYGYIGDVTHNAKALALVTVAAAG